MNSEPKHISEAFKDLPWGNRNAKENRKEMPKFTPVLEIIKCPDCGFEKDGKYMVDPQYRKKERVCVSCQEKRVKEEAIKREEAGRESWYKANVPPRYLECKGAKEELLNASCSIIWGPFGTGKTYEAYSLCHDLYFSKEVKKFTFTTEIGLINRLKGGFSDGTFNRRDDEFRDVDLLVIDEVGKSNDTDFNKSVLFDILNYRYEWMRKTVLICNAEKKEELFNVMPTAILDRYREAIIHIGGKSKRYDK